MQNFTSSGQNAELGAEFFDESHRYIYQFCKELSVQTQDVSEDTKLEKFLIKSHQKTWTASQFRKKAKPLYVELAKVNSEIFSDREVLLTFENMNQYDQAYAYDELSAQGFFDQLKNKIDAEIVDLFAVQVRARLGVDLNMISALHLISFLNHDSFLNIQNKKNLFKMVEGSQALTQNLFERTAGVIPDYWVKTSHALRSIKEHSDSFELTFNTPSGSKVYTAQQVICAMPFTALSRVDGVFDLALRANKKELIKGARYSQQIKTVFEYSNPFWRKKSNEHVAFSQSYFTDEYSQLFWDSGSPGGEKSAVLNNIVSSANVFGLDIDQHQKDILADIDKFQNHNQKINPDNKVSMNWGQREWQWGAKFYFAPQEFHKFSGVAEKPEYKGRLLFAGEHTSLENFGSLEGALASGVRAAQAMVDKAATRSS